MHLKSPGRWSTTNRRRGGERGRARARENDSASVCVCVCWREPRCCRSAATEPGGLILRGRYPSPHQGKCFFLLQFGTIRLTHTVRPISRRWDSCEGMDGATHRDRVTKERKVDGVQTNVKSDCRARVPSRLSPPPGFHPYLRIALPPSRLSGSLSILFLSV